MRACVCTCGQKAKKMGCDFPNGTPTPFEKIGFQNTHVHVSSIYHPNNIYIYICKNFIMKTTKFNGSIYADKYDGLTVRNGRLVNNRPTGKTGIAQAVETKKALKRMEKVSMIAEGVRLGDLMSDAMEME
jgi:hypothetical protein